MTTPFALLTPVSPPSSAPLAHTAQRVFQQLLLGFQTADLPAVPACFTEEATIEYPYAPQLGTAARLQGQPAIRQYLHHALQGMPALVFSQLRLAHDLAQGVHWAEVHCEAPVPGTDRTYRQDYVMRLELRGQQIQHCLTSSLCVLSLARPPVTSVDASPSTSCKPEAKRCCWFATRSRSPLP